MIIGEKKKVLDEILEIYDYFNDHVSLFSVTFTDDLARVALELTKLVVNNYDFSEDEE